MRVRSKSLEPYLLEARIVESIENAPPGSREMLKALVQGYVLHSLLKQDSEKADPHAARRVVPDLPNDLGFSVD